MCGELGLQLGFILGWGSMGKESACNAGVTGDLGSVPGLGRSPGGGHGNLLQYSCLENPQDRSLAGCKSTGLQRVVCDWAMKHACSGWSFAKGSSTSPVTLHCIHSLFPPLSPHQPIFQTLHPKGLGERQVLWPIRKKMRRVNA